MKGIFNKALVIALLTSVAGVYAGPDGFAYPMTTTVVVKPVVTDKMQAVKDAAVATKNGILAAPVLALYIKDGVVSAGSAVKAGAVATKNGVCAVPGMVKSGVVSAGSAVKAGAVATKNGVCAVPSMVKNAAVSAYSVVLAHPYIAAGSALTVAGLAAAYKYNLVAKVKNLFKGEQEEAKQ